jgi:hypothetical protein
MRYLSDPDCASAGERQCRSDVHGVVAVVPALSRDPEPLVCVVEGRHLLPCFNENPGSLDPGLRRDDSLRYPRVSPKPLARSHPVPSVPPTSKGRMPRVSAAWTALRIRNRQPPQNGRNGIKASSIDAAQSQAPDPDRTCVAMQHDRARCDIPAPTKFCGVARAVDERPCRDFALSNRFERLRLS